MKKRTLMLCYCALFLSLIILSALLFRFTIPGTNVMVTLQFMFILLCGQLLPARYCLYTTVAYLLAGLIGLPVFSSAVGPAVLATPSFGYLLAFPAASVACSAVCSRWANKKGSRYTASFIGLLVFYAVAMSYIFVLSKVYLASGMTVKEMLVGYCLVFLPIDFLKAFFAAWLGYRMHRFAL